MPCYSPLKGFKNLENGGIVFKRSSIAGEAMEVPCGACLGCKLDRTRDWAVRIVHEASLYDDNWFVTLTYNEESMPRLFVDSDGTPGPGTLLKEHFQKFVKRLRKRFSARKLRYYHCGEYGDKLNRPHYHAVLFNLPLDDIEFLRQENGQPLFFSQTLQELWPYGFISVGNVTFESAAYVARYVLKKVTGHNAEDHYLRCDSEGVAYWLEPEYTTMSRGYTCKEHRGLDYQVDCEMCSRGIGRDWYEKFKSDVFPSDEVPVPGSGVYKSVPRYYETILASEDSDMHEEIKKLRRAFKSAHSEEYSPQRLETKFKVKKAQVGFLKRSVE